MRKGISPVVAVVLLIAIAVIAAVAVWYWVSPMTGKPATADTTQKSVSITRCFSTGQYLEIRNTGGMTIPTSTNFAIYYQDNGTRPAGNPTVDFNSSLTSGAIKKYGIGIAGGASSTTLNTSVAYFLMYQGIPNANFNC
jgi:flagellin-like protein